MNVSCSDLLNHISANFYFRIRNVKKLILTKELIYSINNLTLFITLKFIFREYTLKLSNSQVGRHGSTVFKKQECQGVSTKYNV